MKNTKQNVLKVLKAMSDRKYDLAKMFQEKGSNELYDEYMNEVVVIERTINMLENPEFFKEIAEIYEVE